MNIIFVLCWTVKIVETRVCDTMYFVMLRDALIGIEGGIKIGAKLEIEDIRDARN